MIDESSMGEFFEKDGELYYMIAYQRHPSVVMQSLATGKQVQGAIGSPLIENFKPVSAEAKKRIIENFGAAVKGHIGEPLTESEQLFIVSREQLDAILNIGVSWGEGHRMPNALKAVMDRAMSRPFSGEA